MLLPYAAPLNWMFQDLPVDVVKIQLHYHSYLGELLGPQACSDADVKRDIATMRACEENERNIIQFKV